MTDKATTPPLTGAEMDLSKLAEIANRVQARGLFNASCDILDWIQEVHMAQARAQQETAAAPKDTPESMAESNARFAIDGAIQYGRENRNAPPSADHWLYEYWNIGQQLRELGQTGWDNVTPLVASQPPAPVVAADAKDAERYRWLRNEAWGGHVMRYKFPHVVEYGPGMMRSGVTELAEEALDAAIDAAIAASQQTKRYGKEWSEKMLRKEEEFDGNIEAGAAPQAQPSDKGGDTADGQKGGAA